MWQLSVWPCHQACNHHLIILIDFWILEGVAKFGSDFGDLMWELISYLVTNEVDAELIYLVRNLLITFIISHLVNRPIPESYYG
jgi:hypothetical protein